MYARGMTTRDIQAHLEEIYGVEVSPLLIMLWGDRIESAWQRPARLAETGSYAPKSGASAPSLLL
jgi:transposase-like protein